ncbi:hypothetical protein MPLB_1730059 [Mesorhizobium sp. ORS 3324]|nr:hypothetical protein MPLB_1730059 [Mesorhizobium sp. ORS 3324]
MRRGRDDARRPFDADNVDGKRCPLPGEIVIHQRQGDALAHPRRRHGYDDEDAFIRARVLYHMQIGYYVLDLEEPFEAPVSHLAAYLRSFTGQEPADKDVAHFMRFIAAR